MLLSALPQGGTREPSTPAASCAGTRAEERAQQQMPTNGTPQHGELPAGWETARSKDAGTVYYINRWTRILQSELPSTPALPHGWDIASSKTTGREYYINAEMGRLSTSFDEVLRSLTPPEGSQSVADSCEAAKVSTEAAAEPASANANILGALMHNARWRKLYAQASSFIPDDCFSPAISMNLYSWTAAVDHAWDLLFLAALIVWGLCAGAHNACSWIDAAVGVLILTRLSSLAGTLVPRQVHTGDTTKHGDHTRTHAHTHAHVRA